MRRLGYGLLLGAGVLLSVSGLAQVLDPSVLSRIQGQLGASSNSASGQLDASRASGEQRLGASVSPGSTAEELELRRQQSRAELDRYYQPSAVEREYQERLGDPSLRLFGYELFRSGEGTGGALTGEVAGNYVLGIGDELVVSFQGATSDSRTVRVDREGRLVVGQLPPVRAAGRTLSAVRGDLAAATRRTLLGTEVYVSLGAVRAISVFVGGEVERPGQYQLTSLGDVAAALSRAGGIRRTGSLRKVRILRGGSSVAVDLYGLLGIGTPPSVRLQDGDRVIVPVIGDTVAVAGSVARPGIYELRASASLSTVLSYAGGALRPRGNRVSIGRISPDGTESFVRVSGDAQTVLAGDAIQVVGGSAGGTAGRVLLRGFVQNPGPRPLGIASSVHELLGEPTDLRIGTYMPMAVLVRRDLLTSSRVYEPVNLVTALRNSPSVPLRSDDRLYVFSQPDIDFLNRTAVRRIVLGQPNPLPQCRSLERLQAIVGDTQSARFSAITRGSFIIRRGGQTDLSTASGALSQRGIRSADDELRTVGDGQPGTGRLSAVQRQQLAARGEAGDLGGAAAGAAGAAAGGTIAGRNAADRQIGPDGRLIDHWQLSEREEAERQRRLAGADVPQDELCPAVFEEDPELLPVLIENAVGVGGAVRRPGAYPVAGSVSAEALVSVAKGTARLEDAVLDITRSTANAASMERVAVDPTQAVLARVTLRAGDDLRVNAGQPQYEAGAVLLSGEFQRPGLYSIRKGETLSQLIARAGGLTGQAYPYGAVYTRVSVKELQQEGLQRTARELNTSLLAAMARRGGQQGDSLLGATQLIRQLTDIEAPGRMVIEADPRVLQMRPDLDTVLEAGDAVFMPKRPNFVLVLGDVNNPGALQFISGKEAGAYLKESGGSLSTADDGRVFLVLPNGTAQPLRTSVWRRNNGVVPPGSTIIVPKNIDPLRTLDLVRDVTAVLAQVVSAVGTIAILATN